MQTAEHTHQARAQHTHACACAHIHLHIQVASSAHERSLGARGTHTHARTHILKFNDRRWTLTLNLIVHVFALERRTIRYEHAQSSYPARVPGTRRVVVVVYVCAQRAKCEVVVWGIGCVGPQVEAMRRVWRVQIITKGPRALPSLIEREMCWAAVMFAHWSWQIVEPWMQCYVRDQLRSSVEFNSMFTHCNRYEYLEFE